MPITQDGYRIGSNGTESGHDWEADEDDIAPRLVTDRPYLVRIQLNGSGDPPSKEFALFGIRNGDPSQTEEQIVGHFLTDSNGVLLTDSTGQILAGAPE